MKIRNPFHDAPIRGALVPAVLLTALAPLALSRGPVQEAGRESTQQTGTPQQQQTKLPTIAEARALMNTDPKASAEAFGRIAAADPKNGEAVFMHAYTLHMSGDLKAAHDRHLAAAEFPQYRALALYNHACVHALWKETDVALQSLREAIDAGFNRHDTLVEDPDMDSLREDPRFKAIVAALDPDRPAAPAVTDVAKLAGARQFDFYVGEWNMMSGDQVEQTVSVARAFGDNGLRVTIRNADGSEVANSLFVYDDENKVWRQTWMSAEGQTITMAGGVEGSAIALRVATDSLGTAMNGRSVFRDIAADSFTYAWETTSDDGKTWTPVATRTFRRR